MSFGFMQWRCKYKEDDIIKYNKRQLLGERNREREREQAGRDKSQIMEGGKYWWVELQLWGKIVGGLDYWAGYQQPAQLTQHVPSPYKKVDDYWNAEGCAQTLQVLRKSN